MSNNSKLPRLFGVPLPTGGEPVAWVVDTNGHLKTHNGPPETSPYQPYGPAAEWTRRCMRGQRQRLDSVLKQIVRYLDRCETPIRDIVNFPTTVKDTAGIARVLLVRAVLIEVGSPLMFVTVWPDGKAEVWSRWGGNLPTTYVHPAAELAWGQS